MLKLFKNMFCRDDLEHRKAKAVAQDKKVRDSLSQKQYDKDLKDTMAGSDPVTRY
jgi:hypothetical protein